MKSAYRRLKNGKESPMISDGDLNGILGTHLKQYKEDRRCKTCNHKLSIYNPNKFCYVHAREEERKRIDSYLTERQ